MDKSSSQTLFPTRISCSLQMSFYTSYDLFLSVFYNRWPACNLNLKQMQYKVHACDVTQYNNGSSAVFAS